MSNTMPRSIRIPDDLWQNALAAARNNDETLTAVVVRALERYVASRAERRYQINDAIDAYVYEHPDGADLHHPDNAKELARWLRDRAY